VIAFDLQEALAFVGETGPYVQYTAVRANKVLRKLEERGEKLRFAAELSAEAMARQLESEDSGRFCWPVEDRCRRWPARWPRASLAHVARYAFQLAQPSATFMNGIPSSTKRIGRRSLPPVDDRFLPPADGAHGGSAGHPDPAYM